MWRGGRGLSPATVDRVINHRGGVDADKEERVLRAARELGLDRRLDFTHRQIRRITVMMQPPENPFHAIELRKGFDAARKLVAALNIQVAMVQTRIDQRKRPRAASAPCPVRRTG